MNDTNKRQNLRGCIRQMEIIHDLLYVLLGTMNTKFVSTVKC